VASYRGGSEADFTRVLVAPGGSVYLAGTTTSEDLPLKRPAMRRQGRYDAWVTKLRRDGERVLYSTYLGGRGHDVLADATVDAAGNLILVGSTNSDDFPTKNAFSEQVWGGKDGYVTKLSPSGDVVFSTFYGGTEGDFATAVDVDAAGSVYVHGYTFSSDFPTTEGALKPSDGEEGQDATVVKLTPEGEVVYATQLGGSGAELGYDVEVDAAGNAYLSGWTDSADFPVVEAGQPEIGGSYDAYVSKLDASGTRLEFSTFLGGRDLEGGGYLAERPEGGVAVALETFSHGLPATGYQERFGGGKEDSYLALLAPEGGPVEAATYLGGSRGDHVQDLDVGADGALYAVGGTGSPDFPVKRAFQRRFGGRSRDDYYLGDAFLAKLSSDLSTLVYGSYLGGSRDDGAASLNTVEGGAWLSGVTYSRDFPTKRAHDPSWNGDSDAWFARVDDA
jgi:hypothetical protein